MLASSLPHQVKWRLAPSSVCSTMLLYYPCWLPLGGLPSKRSPSSIDFHHFSTTVILKEEIRGYIIYTSAYGPGIVLGIVTVPIRSAVRTDGSADESTLLR